MSCWILIFKKMSMNTFSDLPMQVMGMRARQNAQSQRVQKFQCSSIRPSCKLSLFPRFSLKAKSRIHGSMVTGPNDKYVKYLLPEHLLLL